MVVSEGVVAFPFADDNAETWYRVTGELSADRPAPLIALHGGPGATHDYLLALADLADRRAVVHYDQLGNGRSTHYPDRGAEFWRPELFVRELHNLVDALGIGNHHMGTTRMAADPATQRWWSLCEPCQQPLDRRAPGEWWAKMEEVFHMD